jgi:hypothetical protein
LDGFGGSSILNHVGAGSVGNTSISWSSEGHSTAVGEYWNLIIMIFESLLKAKNGEEEGLDEKHFSGCRSLLQDLFSRIIVIACLWMGEYHRPGASFYTRIFIMSSHVSTQLIVVSFSLFLTVVNWQVFSSL